jgi:hypothetical protein
MEVHVTGELEAKLTHSAAMRRLNPDELVHEALTHYFEDEAGPAELAQTREMLNSRYDDLKSGRVKPIPGDEVEAYFREKSAATRRP